MNGYLITITGQVQGVGFRPYIYTLAKQHNYCGWVNNTSEGVHVFIETQTDITPFIDALKEHVPPLAIIESLSYKPYASKPCHRFEITPNEVLSEINLALGPDVAICNTCKNEITHKANRRYNYPFATCTSCGPRVSIIHKLPYERKNTTLEAFPMCVQCSEEYHNPENRRFHAETISCMHCALKLELIDVSSKQALALGNDKAIVKYAKEKLKEGRILAVKGIAGYMLLGDASNPQVVARMRIIKQRPQKPFALMVENLETAEKQVQLSPQHRLQLQSAAAPIVLCRKRKESTLPHNVVFENNFLGIMLPYTPLHVLLMENLGIPLIATSANLQHEPIIYNDDLNKLYLLSDFILTHNRPILIPQDDSLIALTSAQTPIILRRSRGYAPNANALEKPASSTPLLAVGSDLKNTFSLWTGTQLIISQYFGDFENWQVQQAFHHVLKHFQHLYNCQIQQVVCDKNSNYFTHSLAEEMAYQQNIPLTHIQHHKAHFYAVLGDNHLLLTPEPVLGVIWDGMGLGEDHTVWGGEFMKYHNRHMQRMEHLVPFHNFLGDKMAKEPRLSLFALFVEASNKKVIRNKFTDREWSLYLPLIRNNTLMSSSMGRLIDAVSCLLTNTNINGYEAEASMLLEKYADDYLSPLHYMFTDYYSTTILNAQELLLAIIHDLDTCSRPYLASKFFNTLVYWIHCIAEKHHFKHIAFSGGVFQNKVLVELCENNLKQYHLIFHKHLSPNDENISYGQLMATAYSLD